MQEPSGSPGRGRSGRQWWPTIIGGPAYGINQGHYFEWFGTRDGVFGSITYQEFWLGVQVKVN